jgi:type II restriction enzyme
MSEDGPWNYGFEESGALFESASQNARVWTEAWVSQWLYCPNCGAQGLKRFGANSPVADFGCATCAEEYELKSTKGRFGAKVVDGAYATMTARLAADNNPNLILMAYDGGARRVKDLIVVPKQFFTPSIIQRRPPLAATARRAGWVGCNILLGEVPSSGRISIVRGGERTPKPVVLEQWRSTLFLRDESAGARGWLIEVMKGVEGIGRREFSIADAYALEPRLSRLYPGNNNVRPKIRQQLQVLRDQGFIEFLGQGRYRLHNSIS